MEFLNENQKPVATPKDANEMAIERTIMAADRSMMAWVRTGLSLISFGFTIYKFIGIQQQQLVAEGKEVLVSSSPRVFGLLMIGLGILSLVFGSIENVTIVNSYRKYYKFKRINFSLIISVIITVIGIVLFTGIVFKVKGIV